MSDYPVHFLKGLQRLSPQQFEESLKDSNNEYLLGNWSQKVRNNGLLIDLSMVHWVNLSAATQLVLLVEHARKSEINVYVALPLKQFSRDEIESKRIGDEQRERNRKRREAANLFLRVIHFDIAIVCQHVNNSSKVYISETFDPTDSTANIRTLFLNKFSSSFTESPAASIDYSRFKYRYLLPITWINSNEQALYLDDFEKRFQKILTEPERGLTTLDMLSLRNVIIAELIKNVKEHAGQDTQYALISIGLMPLSTLISHVNNRIVINGSLLEERYLKWAASNEVENLIEINFGDSGSGIVSEDLHSAYCRQFPENKGVTKAEQLKVLQWAFNKWSTSKVDEEIRGTKGLYRINRVVNKYNGIITIRSKDLHGGYQKGSYSSGEWVENDGYRNAFHPGTFVQLKLFPYKEINRYFFNFEQKSSQRSWDIERFEISQISIPKFRRWASELPAFKSTNNLLLLLQSAKDNTLSFEQKKDFYGDCLKYLSHLRHPNGIVAYIADDIGKELLDEIAYSTNELILKEFQESSMQEFATPNAENIYDPVLLLGKDNSIGWFGGDQNIIRILTEIYSSPELKTLGELDSYKALSSLEKNNIVTYFHNDDSLLVLTPDQHIEFNFTNIPQFFQTRLEKALSEPADLNRRICTPKLKVTNRWYRLSDILKEGETVGLALALYLKIREGLHGRIISPKTYLLIDHNQQWDLAVEFARLAGLNKRHIVSLSHDIDNSIPRRTQLFDKNDEVIILTTIISSSETIRRLVKFVKRDLAKPICILCLANFREANVSKIKTWEDYTPILNIYQRKHEEADPVYKDEKKPKLAENFAEAHRQVTGALEVVSPDYEDVTVVKSYADLLSETFLPPELRAHIINTKSLYYNHIGNYNGRHFTFYIGKKKLLEKRSFIWERAEKEIGAWMETVELKNVCMVKPVFFRETAHPLDELIEYLCVKFKIPSVQTWKPEKPHAITAQHILYVDFGALTGNSINRFLSSCQGARSIFVCTLFSQFIYKEEEFYTRLRRFEINEVNFESKDGFVQASLFEQEDDVSPISKRMAKVKVSFIFNFPLEFYKSSNCPICEHERALDAYKMQDEYMLSFAIDRKKRLKIREKTDQSSYPCDFYADGHDYQHELSSVLIMRMYEVKLLLSKALDSTDCRMAVFRLVHHIYIHKAEQQKDPDSDLYAFIYLISHEVIWLQKEPLVFRDLRGMISEFCYEISVADLQNLSTGFVISEGLNVLPNRLAVRYKYAAITVLRSSNKLRFCESVSDILLSSLYDGRISNNIAQNTFYHIHSLQQNLYNKSKEYFKIIGGELAKIINERGMLALFAAPQQSVLHKIAMRNERIQRKLSAQLPVNDLDLVIELKREVAEEYEGKNHPDPIEHFVQMDFTQLENFIKDISELRENSAYYENFVSIQNGLLTNWQQVSLYLEKVVHFYLDHLSDDILDSQLFKSLSIYDHMLKPYQETSLIGENDGFTELVYLIAKDVLSLPEYYDTYKRQYQSIYNYFLKSAGLRNEKYDCTLIRLLENFPTSLCQVIDQQFSRTFFPRRKMTSFQEGSDNVFYPKTQLVKYMHLIRDNIERRLNEGVVLSEIDIEFDIQREEIEGKHYVRLSIQYSSTNNWQGEKNEKGALNEFKIDLEKFGGRFNHSPKENYYSIEVKFLKYEQV